MAYTLYTVCHIKHTYIYIHLFFMPGFLVVLLYAPSDFCALLTHILQVSLMIAPVPMKESWRIYIKSVNTIRKQSKIQTVCIILGMYCNPYVNDPYDKGQFMYNLFCYDIHFTSSVHCTLLIKYVFVIICRAHIWSKMFQLIFPSQILAAVKWMFGVWHQINKQLFML